MILEVQALLRRELALQIRLLLVEQFRHEIAVLPVVGKSEAEAEAAHQFQDEPMLLARLILRRQPSLQVAHTHHSLVLRESCESAHMQ